MADSRLTKRKRRRARKWVRTLLSLILILFVIVLCFGGYLFYQAYHAAKQSYTPIDRPDNKSELREKAPTIGKDPISILLVGVEKYSTDGKNGRADTQIVVTLNPDTKQMTMVSIPRDTRVSFPPNIKTGHHKINSSYTYGAISGYGADKLTVKTVENLLHIPIDKYVTVDFQGFADIVKALGGVTIDVKYPFWEYSYFNRDRKIYFHKGPMKMNGDQSLAFVRMRKRSVDTVYTRMERQRQFLKAVIDQAISAGTIFKVDEISNILGKHVETNLKPSEIYALEKEYSSMNAHSIRTLKIDGENKRIPAGTGLYYFVPDDQSLNKVTRELKKSLDLPVSSQNGNGSSDGTENGSSDGSSDSSN